MTPRFSAIPGWLAFGGAALVATIFAGGTVGLLLMGHPVPDQLWMLDIGFGVAYFGASPFSQAMQHQASVSGLLLDTVNHSISTLHTAIQTIGGPSVAGVPNSTTTTPGEVADGRPG